MIHSWLQTRWEQMLALGERLPHALLLCGRAGVGKRDFADALTARLLCARPDAAGHACERCQPCQWRRSGNHPDYLQLRPAALSEAEAGSEAAAAAGEGKSKRASQQIVIEQVRALLEALSLTAHHGGRRVILIEPAEAMNLPAANALLKLLEEPPAGCVFLLLSSQPARLLPTIRSRCQQWTFSPPPAASLQQWAASASAAERALLALSGGLPLAAERLASRGLGPLRERFVRDLEGLRGDNCLQLAGEWEQWLKSKEAKAAAFELPELIDWMQCWVSDLLMLRLGGRLRFFPDAAATIERLGAAPTVAALSGCYNTLLQQRRLARHPLSVRLVLDDMLLRYAAALGAGERPRRRQARQA